MAVIGNGGKFQAFADDSSSGGVGGLTVENGTQEIKVYGDLLIGRDKAGLALALKLKQIVDSAADYLTNAENLPDRVAKQGKLTPSDNPFA
jgi:hypothetical protein